MTIILRAASIWWVPTCYNVLLDAIVDVRSALSLGQGICGPFADFLRLINRMYTSVGNS